MSIISDLQRDNNGRIFVAIKSKKPLYIDYLPVEAMRMIDEAVFFGDLSSSFPAFKVGTSNYYLARTDLTDDVCTGPPIQFDHSEGSESFKKAVLEKIKDSYGVRLRPNGCFAIIDSWSDG